VRAVRYDSFGAIPYVTDVPDPTPPPGGVVIDVTATGVCRSDWHGWLGHDPDIVSLPHIPGHEFAGVVSEVSPGVSSCRVGDRVTVPFVCACGTCRVCRSGNGQVCPNQWQPGFSGPGSFAQRVAIPFADVNVIRLPADLSDVTAAALGCRFATAYRAVTRVARVQDGETVAVFGCGGVGLSVVMIASALGATVVAIDVNDAALARALDSGAAHAVRADEALDATLRDIAPTGVDVGIDALGSLRTAYASVSSLRPRGRHVQIGLLPPAVVEGRESIPMHLVISRELKVMGTHGMAANAYPEMLARVAGGLLRPAALFAGTIGMDEVPDALTGMDRYDHAGVTVCIP
jgi:alcohol dehydrogenase